MASWESDQLVVVMKQGNACGAKGLAGEPRSRDTSSGHRTGPIPGNASGPQIHTDGHGCGSDADARPRRIMALWEEGGQGSPGPYSHVPQPLLPGR